MGTREDISGTGVLDATDIKIVKILQQNAKLTIKEIADQLHLTNTPVYERIKRLEREKVITGYTAQISNRKLDLSLTAFCSVSLQVHLKEHIAQFEQDIQSLPEVMECYHIAGTFDYLLKVVARDMESYQYFIANKLAALSNIGNVKSSLVMSEVKYAQTLPI